MRWLLLLLILIFFQPLAFSQNQPTPPIDLIFDIDWSTFYIVEPGQEDSKTIHFEGKLYRPTDHLEAIIEDLIKKFPQIRITFFSGGMKTRNEFVLKNTHLKDGRSLYDVAFRVFSFEDLTQLSPDATLPFTSRFKKVVSSLIPNWNPDLTLLIDDQPAFALPPLIAVDSMGIYNFQRQFDPTKTSEKFFPVTQESWITERNKALLWQTYIEKAISEHQQTQQPFSQIVKKLWKSPFSPLCQHVLIF